MCLDSEWLDADLHRTTALTNSLIQVPATLPRLFEKLHFRDVLDPMSELSIFFASIIVMLHKPFSGFAGLSQNR